MASLGGTYDTGTISIANGSKIVTGTGTLWTVVAEVGDWLVSDNSFGIVEEVTGDAELHLELNWSGTSVVDGVYVLVKMSWLRYEPAITQQKIRQLLAYLDGVGLFYFVSGTEPDIGIGDDGQFALKVNSGAWKLWYKQAGVWVLQGSPAGTRFRSDVNNGNWLTGVDFLAGDLTRHIGKIWYANQLNNSQEPSDVSTYWDEFFPFPAQSGVCITLDALGSEIHTGIAGDIDIPYSCTLVKITMRADGIGDFVLDIWKKPFDEGEPTVADSITASAKPTLSSAKDFSDSVLTGWTTTFISGDALRFNVDSCLGITRVSITLHVERTWQS